MWSVSVLALDCVHVHEGTCSLSAVSRYQKRISSPLLDRIDVYIEVPCIEYGKLSDDRPGEPWRREGVSGGGLRGQASDRIPLIARHDALSNRARFDSRALKWCSAFCPEPVW